MFWYVYVHKYVCLSPTDVKCTVENLVCVRACMHACMHVSEPNRCEMHGGELSLSLCASQIWIPYVTSV